MFILFVVDAQMLAIIANMKNKLILVYWSLIILIQSFLIYSKDDPDDFILWNIIALIGGVVFIVMRKRRKTNLYESILAGFIGINGITYFIGNLILKYWTKASLGLVIGIISFLVMYVNYSLDKELKRKA